MNSPKNDTMFGASMLVRRPGPLRPRVPALALGMGLTTTMVSILYEAVVKGVSRQYSDRRSISPRTALRGRRENVSAVPRQCSESHC